MKTGYNRKIVPAKVRYNFCLRSVQITFNKAKCRKKRNKTGYNRKIMAAKVVYNQKL